MQLKNKISEAEASSLPTESLSRQHDWQKHAVWRRK